LQSFASQARLLASIFSPEFAAMAAQLSEQAARQWAQVEPFEPERHVIDAARVALRTITFADLMAGQLAPEFAALIARVCGDLVNIQLPQTGCDLVKYRIFERATHRKVQFLTHLACQAQFCHARCRTKIVTLAEAIAEVPLPESEDGLRALDNRLSLARHSARAAVQNDFFEGLRRGDSGTPQTGTG